MDRAEESRVPVDAVICSFRGFVSLSVFDAGLFRRGCFVIHRFDALDRALPEFLGFPLALLVYGSSLGRGVFRVGCAEEEVFSMCLNC